MPYASFGWVDPVLPGEYLEGCGFQSSQSRPRRVYGTFPATMLDEVVRLHDGGLHLPPEREGIAIGMLVACYIRMGSLRIITN